MSEPADSGEPPAGLRLTTAEWGLWQAFRNGTEHDLRHGEAELDDPNGDHNWGPERTVRARVIALLLLHGPPPLLGRVASLHLIGAYVTGCLDLAGGSVEPYFELRQCRFEAEVRMPEARVNTARFVDCYLPRFEGARLTTEGDLHLPRCSIPEGVKLTDASIGTDLLLNEATVGSGRRTRAIAADGISVSQEFQASLLVTDGQVSMRGASVGSSLHMFGSVLRNPRGRYALYAPQMTVEQVASFADAGRGSAPHLYTATPPTGTSFDYSHPAGLRPDAGGGARWRTKHFQCTGGMVLDDGRFGSSLVIENARLEMQRDQELSLRRISTPELSFTPQLPERGLVVLSGASVEKLMDRASSWPGDHRLWMAGFTYQHAIPKEGHFNVRERLQWVNAATAEYAPEPYEQLAAMYRNSGDDTNARLVLLAKQRRRRETLPLPGKLWGVLQDWTVAYGYRPAQAALWMALLWLSSALLFEAHRPPALKGDEAPRWNSVLYTLDLLLPVITFGQDTAWDPAGGYQWIAAGMIMAGWVLATTVAAGATRLLRRQ
ncbi:oxidoreductase [Streptomyces spirodelae]|uniref:Oxidoreductase n=1 Tax=Streptomyces spirodelae TaxID=2812904 RepID=A0ABS3WTB6_9ACTN|nr:oxidoreductase [Streptomyces spirodelae]MBO8186111.1 oxidoreductase [Streptomyces spirodelae]